MAEARRQAGLDALADTLDGAEAPPPTFANDDGEPCPAPPLGYLNRKFYILGWRGDVVETTSRELGKYDIYNELFGADQAWLKSMFKSDRGWSARSAANWYVTNCMLRGHFTPDKVRRIGTYRAPAGIVLHAGDMVRLANGDWRPPGEIGAHVYAASAPIRKPLEQAPAGILPGQELHALLATWPWESPQLAPRLLLGQVLCGFIPGALDWRPHICISGFRGTGKTWLVDLLKDIYGPGYYVTSSDGSPAFVRDRLGGSNRPVFLDEFEQEAGPSHTQMLVRLARLASARSQSGIGRSSPDGITKETKIEACFFFTAINPPPLEPADAGRITVLDLGEFANLTPETAADVRANMQRIGRHGPALFARAVTRWQQLQSNLATYRRALMEIGCDSRTTDQYSHLLAGADLLLSDEATPMSFAQQIVAQLEPAQLLPDDAEDNEAALCMGYLLTTALSVPEDRELNGRTVGELLLLLEDRGAGHNEAAILAVLKRHGLNRVQKGALQYLVVANRHQALAQIFYHSKWANGAWRNILRKHRGALRSQDPVRFLGVRTRAAWIPMDAVVEREPLAEQPSDEAAPL